LQTTYEGWLEFQRLLHWYLWNAIREVYIPYAKALSNLIPAKTVRFRRDISQLFTAIKAHTLLHHDLRFAEGGVIHADIHRTPGKCLPKFSPCTTGRKIL
jgi:hypothetical protein